MYGWTFWQLSCESWFAPRHSIITTAVHSHHGYHHVRSASQWSSLNAADVLLAATTREELQYSIQTRNNYFSQFGLQLNIKKTDIWKPAEPFHHPINGEDLMKTNSIHYLRSLCKVMARLIEKCAWGWMQHGWGRISIEYCVLTHANSL